MLHKLADPRLADPRFAVPSQAPWHVTRKRLLSTLDSACDAPLTLVSAGPGAGKTVLLAQWARRRGTDVAWMPAPTVTPALLQSVWERLPGRTTPLILAIDDAHILAWPEITSLLDAMVEGGDPRLHLVLAARRDPPLPLHRYRLAGQLRELRMPDLAMTPGEIRDVLAAHQVILPGSALDALAARTEGWPAGVRLTALRMRDAAGPGRLVDELSFGHGGTGEYFSAEVLGRLPDAQRRLLIETSFLDEVTAPAAEAITGLDGAGEMLAELSRDSGFVIAIDPAGTRFRYHRMFRDVLRSLRGEGGPPPRSRGAALLARAGALFWQGDHRNVDAFLDQALTLARQDGAVPLEADVLSMIACADSYRSRPHHADDAAARAHSLLRANPGLRTPASLLLAVTIRAVQRADVAGADLSWADSGGADPGIVMAVALWRATLLALTGQPDEARAMLEPGAGLPGPELPTLLRVHRDVLEAEIETGTGKAHAALRLLEPHREGPLAALADVSRGRAYLALDDLDSARQCVRGVLSATRPHLSRYVLVESMLLDATIADRARDPSRALEMITNALDVAGADLVLPFAHTREALGDLLTRHPAVADRWPAPPAGGPWSAGAMATVRRARELPLQLTQREKSILAYLATSMTAGEIADELYLSVNTVKTHLAAIYRKLGAGGRRAAVRRARELELLLTERHMIDRLTIFGATGDLTARFLLPGLAALHDAGLLSERFRLTGSAREDWDGEHFRSWAADQLGRHAPHLPDQARRAVVAASDYRRADVHDPESVAHAIAGDGPVAAYLALPPAVFPSAVAALRAAGVPSGSRVVLEKPFGEDLASAASLNRLLAQDMTERDVFRVDHFLAMTTVQNVLGFRLANRMLEPIWNSSHIAEIDIVWEEELALEGRATYYDGVGALKDMVQNHLLQLLCLAAMEPPVSLGERDLRDRKVDVLRSVRRLSVREAAHRSRRARYSAGRIGDIDIPAYVNEEGVDPDHPTETFAEVRLEVENWRWLGTAFRIRTGKAFGRDRKEVVVRFRDVPHLPSGPVVHPLPNVLRFGLEPESLGLELAGIGGRVGELSPLTLTAQMTPPQLPAYGQLLLDVLNQHAALSIRGDEAEESWRVVTPVLDAWSAGLVPMEEYAAGSDGPPTVSVPRPARPREAMHPART